LDANCGRKHVPAQYYLRYMSYWKALQIHYQLIDTVIDSDNIVSRRKCVERSHLICQDIADYFSPAKYIPHVAL